MQANPPTATAPEAGPSQNTGRMKTGVGKVMAVQKVVNHWKDRAQLRKYLGLYHDAISEQLPDKQRAKAFKDCWVIRQEVVDDLDKATNQTAWLMMALENEFGKLEDASARLREFLETQVPVKSYSDEDWKRPSNLVQAFQQKKVPDGEDQATKPNVLPPSNISSNYKAGSEVAGRSGKSNRSNQEGRSSKVKHSYNSGLRLEYIKDDIEMLGQTEADSGRLNDGSNEDEAQSISTFRKVSRCVVNFFKRLWNKIQS